MRGLKFVHWLGSAVAVQIVLAAGVMGLGSAPAQEPKVLGVSIANKDKAKDNNGTGDDKRVVVAGGTIGGLFPGATKDLPVLLENPNNFDVVVTELYAGVAHASAACTAANVDVDDFNGRRVVPGNGSATQALVVRMADDAPDACKSVEWRLTYSGRAEKDKP